MNVRLLNNKLNVNLHRIESIKPSKTKLTPIDINTYLSSNEYINGVNQYDEVIDLLRSVVTNMLSTPTVPGIMIYGSAGIGKTYNVTDTLDKLKNTSKYMDLMYHVIKGKITPTQLYNFTANHNSENDVIIFDDCDTAFTNNDSMNLIKAMTDTYEHRIVSYRSPVIDIPEFEFNGKLICITNQEIISNEHYNALRDRMLLFKLEVPFESKFAKSVSILTRDDRYKSDESYRDKVNFVINYMLANLEVFRIPEYSLRTTLRLLNVLDLVGMDRFDKFIHQMPEFNFSQSINYSAITKNKLLDKLIEKILSNPDNRDKLIKIGINIFGFDTMYNIGVKYFPEKIDEYLGEYIRKGLNTYLDLKRIQHTLGDIRSKLNEFN